MIDQNLYPQFELSGLGRDLVAARTEDERDAIRAAILDTGRRLAAMKFDANGKAIK